MNYNIILSIIISLIVIVILHNLFIFFKNNLTAPKIKDFIDKPSKDYEEIYNIINDNKNNNLSVDTTNLENLPVKKVHFVENNLDTNTNLNLINNKNNNLNMKNELKNFLNNLSP